VQDVHYDFTELMCHLFFAQPRVTINIPSLNDPYEKTTQIRTYNMDSDARRAEDRQWATNSHKIRDGHWKISAGTAPESLKMTEPKGPKVAQIVDIHQLQQEVIEAASLRGENGLADMKKELQARRLFDDLDGSYYPVYKIKLCKLRDDLKLAALADVDEQSVDTLGKIFQCLQQSLVKSSPEVKRKTAENLSAKFGVSLADHVDVETMFERPKKKIRRQQSPSTSSESQNNGDEAPEDAMASKGDSNVDNVKGEGGVAEDSHSKIEDVKGEANVSSEKVNGEASTEDVRPNEDGVFSNISTNANVASGPPVGTAALRPPANQSTRETLIPPGSLTTHITRRPNTTTTTTTAVTTTTTTVTTST